MDDQALQNRLDALERRLSALEATRIAQPTFAPAVPVPDPSEKTPADTPAFQLPPRLPAPRPHSTLEQTIGLKWAGWVGAIAVVIAAGLGIRFAYDHGWFALVSPVVRVGLLGCSALVLLGTGELVFRRVSPLAAAGFFAAGVAMLFVTSYAGQAYYGLYGPGAAWVLMAVSTVAGTAVARRSDLVSVAVLSLLGGFLAPLVLWNALPGVVPFCGYLLMLQGLALGLAWRSDARWGTLRAVSLAGTAAWLILLLPTSMFDGSPIVIVFLLASGLLYQVELVASADGPASLRLAATNFSLLVTAAVTAGGLYHFRDSAQSVRVVWVLGLAGATACCATLLWINATVTSAVRASTGTGLLAAGFVVQTAALLATVVPVLFAGVWIAAAWAVLALAFAVLARRLDLPIARWMAAGTWLLAVVDAFFWTVGFNPTDTPAHLDVVWLSLGGTPVPAYTAMGLLLALAGHAVSRLIDRPANPSRRADRRWRDLSESLALAADLLAVAAALIGVPPLPATALLGCEVALLAAGIAGFTATDLLPHAAGLLLFAAGKWLIYDTLACRLVLGTFAISPHPVLNAVTIDGVLLLAAAVATTQLAAAGRPRSSVPEPSTTNLPWLRCVRAIPVLALLWIGSFEIDRAFQSRPADTLVDPALAEHVALSVFWSLFAVAAVLAGFVRHSPPLRYFGLGLFACTAVKVVLVDLNQVSTGYRILSFLALGLLLLGTSVLYGRVSGDAD